MAVVSIWLSGLELSWRWGLALGAGVYGLWAAVREVRTPIRSLVIPGDDAPVLVDGEEVAKFSVAWRGPLATLSWCSPGRKRRVRLLFWPDTLPAPRRRELRLAAASRLDAERRQQMAP